MDVVRVERAISPPLARAGFAIAAIEASVTFQGRMAWAIYYRSQDCKLQLCWSAREGGIDFLLAPPDAPNEFGLENSSGSWQFMLMLSEASDDLVTPAPGADEDVEVDWLVALFETHIESARRRLALKSDI